MSRQVWRKAAADDGVVPFAAYHGTPGDDRLIGTRSYDQFYLGQGGDDRVSAGRGVDLIALGADFTGADRVNGGGGRDQVQLEGDYSAGIDVRAESLVKIETLLLLGGPYVIRGTLGYSEGPSTVVIGALLEKGESLDITVASAGNLLVIGGDGDDVLHAATNGVQSYLDGADGDDRLIGGGGGTVLLGGAGADRIEMVGAEDIAAYDARDSTAKAFDTIVGFEASGGRIRLAFDSDTTTRGLQHDFHLGETAGRVGDITATYDAAAGETIVRAFTDGDATADFVVHLTGEVSLTTADFIFGG